MDTYSVTNATRSPLPRGDFSYIKDRILGKRYTLSVVYVSRAKMQKLNHTYRKKNEPTDILSFPLSKTHGEIVLHADTVKKKSKTFELSPRAYLTFLFIHGCLHLKGHQHGRTMEKLEDRWCKALNTPPPTR